MERPKKSRIGGSLVIGGPDLKYFRGYMDFLIRKIVQVSWNQNEDFCGRDDKDFYFKDTKHI